MVSSNKDNCRKTCLWFITGEGKETLIIKRVLGLIRVSKIIKRIIKKRITWKRENIRQSRSIN
jgi:hypothetical protein